MREKKYPLQIYISYPLFELLIKEARNKKMSRSAIGERALRKYLQGDVMEEIKVMLEEHQEEIRRMFNTLWER
jgi:hypothetical protein